MKDFAINTLHAALGLCILLLGAIALGVWLAGP